MTVASLIAELEGRGIVLSLVDGEIRYRSPKGALTEADKTQLRSGRGAIIAYLQARQAARGLRSAGSRSGPLTPSVAQEMWRAFAGGAEEGKPVALNIGMVGTFRHDAGLVTAAIRQVIARYEALRVRFEAQGGALRAHLNPAEAFVIEQEDLRGLNAEAAGQAAEKGAQAFCALVNLIEGEWLTRAKVFALPEGKCLAVLSSAHMIADAGTRNIVLDEIHDILDHGAPQATPSAAYNDYSLAEREFLAGPQGAQLIDYWRRWYQDQPVMKAPSDGAPLLWGNGIRIVKNFTIPRRVLDKVRALAERWKVTPFLVYLTIFALTMARWSGMEGFPLRVLGDKRTTLELANMVGLMFCADAVDIRVPQARILRRSCGASWSSMMQRWRCAFPRCTSGRRIVCGPASKRPIIPTRFRRCSTTIRSVRRGNGRRRKPVPTPRAAQPWPPDIVTLPARIGRAGLRRCSCMSSTWTMKRGCRCISTRAWSAPTDQDSFTALLFQVFAETVPV